MCAGAALCFAPASASANPFKKLGKLIEKVERTTDEVEREVAEVERQVGQVEETTNSATRVAQKLGIVDGQTEAGAQASHDEWQSEPSYQDQAIDSETYSEYGQDQADADAFPGLPGDMGVPEDRP